VTFINRKRICCQDENVAVEPEKPQAEKTTNGFRLSAKAFFKQRPKIAK